MSTSPQCGSAGGRRKEGELSHDYRCNKEFHSRQEIDISREEFNWKVVEPYDGTLQRFVVFDL